MNLLADGFSFSGSAGIITIVLIVLCIVVIYLLIRRR